MEEKITDILDNLDLKQTEDLLKTNKRIKNSVFEKAGLKKRRTIRIITIISIILVVSLLAYIGYDKLRQKDAYLPYVGLIKGKDFNVYNYDPIVSQIEEGESQAKITRAVYTRSYLSITVEVTGTALYQSDFSFYKNGKLLKYEALDNPYALYVKEDSTTLFFDYWMDPPKEKDIFEIEIKGFDQRLSFKTKVCKNLEDLEKIGPSAIKEQIGITTSTKRIDNQLIVWIYPLIMDENNKDQVIDIGQGLGFHDKEKYIETDSGQVYPDSFISWYYRRSYFKLEEGDTKAILHIPYLTMYRKEDTKTIIKLPESRQTNRSEIIVKTSLGDIKILEIERVESSHNPDIDTIYIKFDITSNEANKKLFSFDYEIMGKNDGSIFSSNDTLRISLPKENSNVKIKIKDLYYYLLEDYIIPLNIN